MFVVKIEQVCHGEVPLSSWISTSVVNSKFSQKKSQSTVHRKTFILSSLYFIDFPNQYWQCKCRYLLSSHMFLLHKEKFSLKIFTTFMSSIAIDFFHQTLTRVAKMQLLMTKHKNLDTYTLSVSTSTVFCCIWFWWSESSRCKMCFNNMYLTLLCTEHQMSNF